MVSPITRGVARVKPIFLVLPVGLGLGIAGLAIAQSVVAVVEVVILMSIMQRRSPGLFTFRDFSGALTMLLAAAISGGIMYGMIRLFPLRASDVGFFAIVPKFVLIVGVTLVAYVLLSYLFRIKESRPVVDRLLKLVFKPVRIN